MGLDNPPELDDVLIESLCDGGRVGGGDCSCGCGCSGKIRWSGGGCGNWAGASCGEFGAEWRSVRRILAVGGGGPREVLPLLGRGCLLRGDMREPARARFSTSLPFFCLAGVTPPYFSRSCWVELYLVAAFNLSIVVVRWRDKVSR